MKAISSVTAALLGIASLTVHAQDGAFHNLDFEDSTLPLSTVDAPPGYYPAPDALPGWIVKVGDAPQGVFYHTTTAGSPAVILADQNNEFVKPLDGNFSVQLIGTRSPGLPNISQSGYLAADTRSILLVTDSPSAMTVTFNGERIPLQPLHVLGNPLLFGGDVSAFAGLAGELQITATPPALGALISRVVFDDIQFSPVPVPEPSTWSLEVVSGVLGMTLLRLVGRERESL